ncbi:MAG: carbon storage regulator CsrA [Solirubrobacteraceae bacterium]
MFPHPSSMLVLTRKPGEAIVIGDDVEIEIVAIGGGKVRVGITAPRSTTVHRKEVYVELQAQEAGASDPEPSTNGTGPDAAAEAAADAK